MITYFIKVILCSALLMLSYKVLFEKEKMLRFNRLYLLLSLPLSFIIPAITIGYSSTILQDAENIISYNRYSPDTGAIQQISTAGTESYMLAIFLIAYTCITIIFLLRFIYNLKSLFSKICNNEAIPYKTAKIISINEAILPHSFLHYIFINKEEYNTASIEDEILAHEYAHTHQKHSYDILFMEILRVFFWFNPFVILYRKAIELNHEFLADEAVLASYNNIRGYQYLLINKAGKNSISMLTSRFNFSITKKRFLMMTKAKSAKGTVCRQIAVAPVLAIALFIFSNKIYAQDSSTTKQTKQLITAPSTQEGVSHELMNEYAQIVNKSKNKEGVPVFEKLTAKDKERLEVIFLAMSKEQQLKQMVMFIPCAPPLQKTVPTEAQMGVWKNSKLYGVWIDEKRVSNAELNNYKNTDFSQVFVSKLMKNAINYGKHYYQVNLLTNDYYLKYYNETIESKNKYNMVIYKSKP